jgi:hypothetical protein
VARNTNIDLGLSALVDNALPGETLSWADIADVCDCTRNYIFELEKNALAKLRKKPILIAHHAALDYPSPPAATLRVAAAVV